MIHVSFAPRLVPPNGVFFSLAGRKRGDCFSETDFAESTEHEIPRQIQGGKGRPSPRKPAELRITERKAEIGKTQ